jgi:hypothetical protein
VPQHIPPLAGLVLLAGAGCGGESLDLGSNDGGSGPRLVDGAGGDDGPKDSAWLVPIDVAEPDVADTAGSANAAAALPVGRSNWSGYIENYNFPSGSDAIGLTLDVAYDAGGLGAVGGTVLFGGLPLLPAPTDPNLGWPPNDLTSDVPLEHFPFTVENATLSGAALGLSLNEHELFAQWCTLQTHTFPWPGFPNTPIATYSCLPPAGGPDPNLPGPVVCQYLDPTTNRHTRVDCGKLFRCERIGAWSQGPLPASAPTSPCTCSAIGCRPMHEPHDSVSFALKIARDRIDGTIVGLWVGLRNVHLTRSP